jgi:predicted nucleotidyltransferase
MKKYVDEAVECLKGEKVTAILFGSVARGEQTAISDIDILVIADPEYMSEADKQKFPPKVSAYIVSRTELNTLAYTNSLVIAALLEGVVLINNLNIGAELERMKKDLQARGAEVTTKQIRYPKPPNKT